ncbi:MAG: right-handed parallel beta-helix repeat-containing protein [Pseudomonadota bacterium]|nr:right-handed parallel beta-helix repeat-containing protein [Pseudomonadota bacterium]
MGFVGPPAFAQATRTWVSGVGDDANPCSRTAPCKTFAGAMSKTATAGEINVLDPGGFGVVTINHSITIRADHVEAGVLATGTNGITVAAGPIDQVVLEGLDIEGLGSGLDGIAIQSAGEVLIKNCNIHQFTRNGVTITTNAMVRVIIRASTIGENGGSGVVVNSTPGFGHVRIFDSLILTNTSDGVQVNGAANEALLSNAQILGNLRQLNVSTGVSGGIIYSLGNNTILNSGGDNPTPFPIK